MKAWRLITVMIWYFPIILRIQRQVYSNTLITTTPPLLHIAQRRQHHLPHLFRHCLQMAHLRNHSQLGIAKKRSTLPMNWKSTLNSLQRTLRLATQFSGGWADEVNFHISFSWCTIFFLFLVSILGILIHVSDATQIWFISHRFCCCCWKDLLWWVGHHFSLTRQSSSQHNSHTYACQEALASYQTILGLYSWCL